MAAPGAVVEGDDFRVKPGVTDCVPHFDCNPRQNVGRPVIRDGLTVGDFGDCSQGTPAGCFRVVRVGVAAGCGSGALTPGSSGLGFGSVPVHGKGFQRFSSFPFGV